MTPEQIAASLTPAQVRALAVYMDGRDFPSATVGFSLTSQLLRLDLLENGPGMTERITPLGLAVLAALDKGVAT